MNITFRKTNTETVRILDLLLPKNEAWTSRAKHFLKHRTPEQLWDEKFVDKEEEKYIIESKAGIVFLLAVRQYLTREKITKLYFQDALQERMIPELVNICLEYIG